MVHISSRINSGQYIYESLLRKYHDKTHQKEGKEKGKTRTFLDTIMGKKIMFSD